MTESYREVTLEDHEQEQLADVLSDARARVTQHQLDETDALDWLATQTERLPVRLHESLARLTGDAPPHVLVVRGLPFDPASAGPTPTEYRRASGCPVEDADLLHGALAVAAGMPVGFRGQQHGRLVNDIVPLAEHRHVANHSGGFLDDFGLHTEDSFLPSPPAAFGLFCVRNPDRVPSRLAAVPDALTLLSAEDVVLLRSARVRVHPNAAQTVRGEARQLPLVPVLWGPTTAPCFRVNEAGPVDADEAVLATLTRLYEALKEVSAEVCLDPGDALWVDNRRVAHGRDRYPARLDGSDRWMKRLVVVDDPAALAPLVTSAHVIDADRLLSLP